jgi:radical SAM protein with 4Fe4S-binding SPASM domain
MMEDIRTPMTQMASRTYQVVTNLSCNLDCSYCYERKYPKNNKAEDIIDFMHACFERDKDLKDIEVIIDIIGGEPFLQPKLLIAAFETAEELAKKYNRPYLFSISTNGTLFDKPINRQIVERWRDRLSIGVSIDGLPEQHDKYRIYTSTRGGSYHKAVEGYNYLKEIGIYELGVKATFTLETLPFYAAGMKSLIDVTGGGTIAGNVTYEDIMPRHMATGIALQMMEVIEYWEEKGLHLNPDNRITHIIPTGLNFGAVWDPNNRDRIMHDDTVKYHEDRTRTYCGTVVFMTCLGFDRNIYGCNRFMSTVTSRNAVAKLVGRKIINTDGEKLLTEIKSQYKDYPDTCMGCPMKQSCGSCAAAAYENGDGEHEARKEYHAERRQCGWTTALLLVAAWYHERHGTYNCNDLHTDCGCFNCRQDRLKKHAEKAGGPAKQIPVVNIESVSQWVPGDNHAN